MDENTRTCIESKFFTFRPTSADGPGDVFLLYKNMYKQATLFSCVDFLTLQKTNTALTMR